MRRSAAAEFLASCLKRMACEARHLEEIRNWTDRAELKTILLWNISSFIVVMSLKIEARDATHKMPGVAGRVVDWALEVPDFAMRSIVLSAHSPDGHTR